MLKFLFIISLSFLSLYGSAQDRYVIKGHLSKVKTGKVFLMGADRKTPVDSAVLRNGNFIFKGIADQDFLTKGYYSVKKLPVMSGLVIKPLKEKPLKNGRPGNNSGFQWFYLEKGLTEVNGATLNTAVIRSGKTQEEYRSLSSVIHALEKGQEQEMERLASENKTDPAAQKEALEKYNELTEKWRIKIRDQELKFVDEHPKSLVSLDIISEFAVVIDPVEFEPLFNKLDPSVQQTPMGKSLSSRLKIAKRTAVGQQAMDFTVKDTLGNPISLSSLKGKYVLIDFWSSGCFPCRMETPNVLKAYQKFKDKNFEVMSISLDTEKELWMNAIHKDGMPWINVCDLKGFSSPVAVQYGIRAIPQTFLVNPEGMIVGRELRGEKLMKELERLIVN